MSDIKYPAARSQRVIHAAPQFRPLRRGARRKGIERIYECKDGSKVTIAIFEELDTADQDVLLCLLAMARSTEKGVVVTPQTPNPISQALRAALKLDGCAADKDALRIDSSFYELLVELGRDTSKASYDWLRRSLIRLTRVSFVYSGPKGWWTFHLLSASGVLVGSDETLSVCINPLSARAILADTGAGGYTLTHRGERRELKTDEAKGLHFVLCGLVDMGAERTLNVDMLADKVYSRYDEEVDASVVRRRRKSLVDTCAQLDTLGYWSCKVIGRGADAAIKVERKRRTDLCTISE